MLPRLAFLMQEKVVDVGEQGFTQPLHISVLFRLCYDEFWGQLKCRPG